MPDLTASERLVGVPTHQGGHVEGHREPAAAGSQDVAEAAVGLLGVAEPGELPDGPEPPAIARGVQPPRERELPRPADLGHRLAAVGRTVHGCHLVTGQGGEVGVADLA